MEFIRKSSPKDPVICYVSTDGFYRITKRPTSNVWVLTEHSLFSILGEVIGKYPTLETAFEAVN